MTVYVDADACPVRAEAIRTARRHGRAVYLVSNGGIRPDPDPEVHVVVVPQDPDAADKWIAERAAAGDVCVTSDLPLAAAVIAAGGTAIAPDGTVHDAGNIGPRLANRDLMADLRAADPFRQGGGRPFTKADRARFLSALDALL
ncbi:MAG: YaiI/YqxD family protein, partial [Pseudomonadota bacterium]